MVDRLEDAARKANPDHLYKHKFEALQLQRDAINLGYKRTKAELADAQRSNMPHCQR